jgi:hypothetical protein
MIKKNDLIILLIVALLISLAIRSYFKAKRININYKYSVCTTVYSWRPHNSRAVNYVYYVNNKKFTNNYGFTKKIIVPNGRYLIKYSVDDPKIHEVYIDCWVPHEISPPSNGWDSIPSILDCSH